MRAILASILLCLVAADTFAAEVYVFTRPGCGPCDELKKAAAADRTLFLGFDLYMIDGAARPDIARRFGVRAYPTIVVVDDGRELRRTSGFSDAESLRAFLDRPPQRRRSR